MPIRTAGFIAGALAVLLIAGAVTFVTAPDPWEPDPTAVDRLDDTTDGDPLDTGTAATESATRISRPTKEQAAALCRAVDAGTAYRGSADGTQAIGECQAARNHHDDLDEVRIRSWPVSRSTRSPAGCATGPATPMTAATTAWEYTRPSRASSTA